jgi:hypothetical protein
VTWQDELQYWETELAAGRISPEEYQTRCALVRARSDEQPAWPPDNEELGTDGQPDQSPFPPPFTWSNAAAQGSSNPAQDAAEESTQVIHNPLATLRTAASADFDTGHGAFPQGWQTYSTPGPQGPRVVASPPPTAAGDTPSWMHHGAEVFDTAAKPTHRGAIVGLSAGAAVVLLVAIAVIVTFAFPGVISGLVPGHGTRPAPAAQQPPAPPRLAEPPAAKPTPPADSRAALISTLPGSPHPFNGPFGPADLAGQRQGLLPAQVRDFAQRSGMIDGWFRGTSDAPTISLIAIRMPTQNAAEGLAQQYLDGQEGLSVDNSLSYRGVKVMSTGGTVRTAYVTYQWTIILEVTGPSVQAAHDGFSSVLGEQLAQSPPTVRG